MSVVIPDPALVDGTGQALVHNAGPRTVGIDLLEGPNGDDSLTILRRIADLRARRIPVDTIVAEPGACTPAVMEAVALFNAEVYAAEELVETAKERIQAAVAKRERKNAKRRKQLEASR